MRKLLRLLQRHLILPFQESDAPAPQVAWGAAIGLFIGLTPTMGVQMYLSAAVWVICRYGLRLNFNLPIAIAMVWISNPVTVVPLYFGYLKSGDWLLGWLGYPVSTMDYATFEALFHNIGQENPHGWWERTVEGILLVFWKFGWPIVVGGLAWAISLSIASYPAALFAVLRYRKAAAARTGVSYQEWKREHIHPR